MEENGEDHEWISSLNGSTLFTADIEEANFMAQLFNIPSDPYYYERSSSNSSSSSFFKLSQEISSDVHHQFIGGNYCSQQLLLFPTSENESFCNINNPMNLINSLGDHHQLEIYSNNNNVGDFQFEDQISESDLQQPNNNNCNSQAEFIKLPEEDHEEIIAMDLGEGGHHDDQLHINNAKKRSKGSDDVVQKKKNERSKKTHKLITSSSNTEEDGNAGHSRQSTSNYCSEDESNASLELNGGVNNNPGSSSKGPTKSRASRGSATDPQSLYARKRRERINERLRILQNLVPNGTKVDISTMLEEAVQYVKFLQLQIKLLSSDDLWMYAPIAYNGMDIGLNRTPNMPKEL